jgi:hypothetical protein
MSMSVDTRRSLCSRQIKRFEKLETDEERWRIGKEIYDQFIMKELLSNSHVSDVAAGSMLVRCCSLLIIRRIRNVPSKVSRSIYRNTIRTIRRTRSRQPCSSRTRRRYVIYCVDERSTSSTNRRNTRDSVNGRTSS